MVGTRPTQLFVDVVSFSNPLSFEVIWGTQPGIGPAITMMWLRARKVLVNATKKLQKCSKSAK